MERIVKLRYISPEMVALLLNAGSSGWFARHSISAESAAILGGIIAAAATLLAVYIGDWLPSSLKRRKDLKDRLVDFAHVLLGLASQVERGERPTQYGHRLTELLLRLDDRNRRRIEKVALGELIELGALEARIGEMDQGSSDGFQAKERWVHDARKLAGTLQAIAASM
jgi:hypothetical protein